MVMNSDVSYIGGMLQSQIHRYTLQTKQEMEQQEAMSLLSNRNGGFTLTPDEPSPLSFTFADDNSYFECPWILADTPRAHTPIRYVDFEAKFPKNSTLLVIH